MLVRKWNNGDWVEVQVRIGLHAALVLGGETQQAMMFGLVVLAGLSGDRGLSKRNTYTWALEPRLAAFR